MPTERADPDLVALDLLAQAEHGPDSVAIVVSDVAALLDAVAEALPRQAANLETGDRALATIRAHGAAVVVANLDTGIDVINAVAAEHVSLQCAGAEDLAVKVRNAGAIFIGPWSPIAAGDYATGTNHVLPTGAAARAWSGVGVEAFGRWIEVQQLTPAGVRAISPIVDAIAAAEGLPAHAASVRARAGLAPRRSRRRSATMSSTCSACRARVEAYPAEPSDEELAERAGIEVSSVVRADMNTMGGGALPSVVDGLRGFDGTRSNEYGDLAYRRLAVGARCADRRRAEASRPGCRRR